MDLPLENHQPVTCRCASQCLPKRGKMVLASNLGVVEEAGEVLGTQPYCYRGTLLLNFLLPSLVLTNSLLISVSGEVRNQWLEIMSGWLDAQQGWEVVAEKEVELR